MRQTRKRQRGGSNYKLENVLGVTAAVGYNKEVLPQATALSKNTRSNYLTQSLKNKKYENYFFAIEPEDFFWYALLNHDVYRTKQLLKNPPPELKNSMKNPKVFFTTKKYFDERIGEDLTYLDYTINWLLDNDTMNRSPFRRKAENKDILELAVEFAKYIDTLNEELLHDFIIHLPRNSIRRIVEVNPNLAQQVVEYLAEIVESKKIDLESIISNAENYASENNHYRRFHKHHHSFRNPYNDEIQEARDEYNRARAVLKAIAPDYYASSNYINNNDYSISLRKMYGNENM